MNSTYKRNTHSFVYMINNGWLHNPKESIDKVYKQINNLILNKKTMSSTFNIFHASLVKKYIEDATNNGVEVIIVENTVCGKVYISINIDYDVLSDSEYYQLKKTVKKNIPFFS